MRFIQCGCVIKLWLILYTSRNAQYTVWLSKTSWAVYEPKCYIQYGENKSSLIVLTQMLFYSSQYHLTNGHGVQSALRQHLFETVGHDSGCDRV